MINSIYYFQRQFRKMWLKMLKEALYKEFNIFPQQKNRNSITSERNVLYLGRNICHQIAFYISDLPIILLDRHSDAYSSSKRLSCENWIYWALKKGREVHFVIPNEVPDSHGERFATIPKDSTKLFFVYTLGKESTLKIPLEKRLNPKTYDLNIENIEKLYKRVESRPNQISLDFDFITTPEIEDLGIDVKILKKLRRVGSIYDFWFDYTSFSGQLEKCVELINIINEEK